MLEYTSTFSGFSVSDLKAAHDFYANKLGMKVDETPEGLVLMPVGGQRVFLYPKADHQPASYTVWNISVPDIGKAVDELSAGGVIFEHYDFSGYKTDAKGILKGGSGPKGIAWFKDPSGNILSVIQEK